MKVLAATTRTISAIRKADALPRIEPGGKMRKGSTPCESGDTYTGYFSQTNASNVITVAAGKGKAGNTFFDTAETPVTATAAGFVILTVTYSAGYVGTVSFATSLSNPIDGNDIVLLYTVDWADGAISAVNRQINGVALVTGKAI